MASTSNNKLSSENVLQLVEILQPIARATEDPARRLDLCNQIDNIFARMQPTPVVMTGEDRALREQIAVAFQAQAVIRGDLKEKDDDSPVESDVESVMLSDGVESKSLEAQLNALRERRTAYNHSPIYIPPMAKSSLNSNSDDSFSLIVKVREFLASERQVMLIIGDSGVGKSTFNVFLERELWENYTPGGAIPLLINLPAISDPERQLIDKQLRIYNFSDDQIYELKKNHRFVFICDGYDEAQMRTNIYATNLLNQPDQYQAKMIISCRTQYLGSDYRARFQPPPGRYDEISRELFQEAVVTPFSKVQIDMYVEQYVEQHASRETSTWVKADYMDKLKSIPNLMDLVTNPYLLTLSLRVLPKVAQDIDGVSRRAFTRTLLYDAFVDDWLHVHRSRLQSSSLSEEGRATFDMMQEAGFRNICVTFQMELATAIFEKQEANPVVMYSHLRDKNTWKAEFFSPDSKTTLLRESSLITRSGNVYRFIHRSFLEYFYSRSIVGDSHDPVDLPLSVAGHPLSQRSLIDEPSIVQFLCDRVQQNSSFKQELLTIVERSKTDSMASQAAANAVTILFRAGCRLCRIDMQGVRIPGADLSGGELDSVLFQGADMTGVNLSRSWMRQADFSNAIMSGVQFGEWPFISIDKEPTVCAYSNDGRTLAVGLITGDIVIYDTATWTVTHTLSGHNKAVTNLAYFPSEHQLFSASKDGTWRVWNLSSSVFEQTHDGGGSVVSSIAVSPNGRQVATGGADKLVRLWFPDVLSQSHCLQGHVDAVTCLAYSPNGSLLASGSSDRTVRLWNTSNGKNILTLQGHTDSISSIVFAPGGQCITSGSNDTTVRVWDALTGKSLAILTSHTDRVSAVAYAPNGQYFLSASWDRTVRVWDSTLPHTQLSVLRGATKIITGLSVSPFGSGQVAACCNDKTVRLWDASLGISDTFVRGAATESSEHIGGVSTMAISPDGQQLATGGYDTTIRTCDTSTGQSLGPPLHAHKRSVAAVAFSPTAQVLASASWDHTIHLWDTEQRELNKIINAHLASITSLIFLPSGQLISGSADWTVRLWNLDLDSHEPVRTFRGHTQGVRSVACSSDGLLIASASEDNTVRVWTLDSHFEQREVVFEGHSDAVTCVAFSPIRHQIASASNDKSIRLWNLESDIESGPIVLLGHQAGLQCVAYSTCGQYLASGSDDNSVIVWRVSSGSKLEIIGDVFGGISSIVWKQDVLELIAGCKDGSVRAWRVLVEGEEDNAQVQLDWGTGFGHLVATNACIDGTVGLSSVAFKLLKQLGAIGEMSREGDEALNEVEE